MPSPHSIQTKDHRYNRTQTSIFYDSVCFPEFFAEFFPSRLYLGGAPLPTYGDPRKKINGATFVDRKFHRTNTDGKLADQLL